MTTPDDLDATPTLTELANVAEWCDHAHLPTARAVIAEYADTYDEATASHALADLLGNVGAVAVLAAELDYERTHAPGSVPNITRSLLVGYSATITAAAVAIGEHQPPSDTHRTLTAATLRLLTSLIPVDAPDLLDVVRSERHFVTEYSSRQAIDPDDVPTIATLRFPADDHLHEWDYPATRRALRTVTSHATTYMLTAGLIDEGTP